MRTVHPPREGRSAPRRRGPFFGTESGAVAYMAALAVAAATSIGFARMIGKGRSDVVLAAKEAAEATASTEAQRLIALGGFMISNSLIACKEGEWSTGGKQTCQWVGDRRKDVQFTPQKFGLSNLRYEKQTLVFDASPPSGDLSKGGLSVVSAQLSFDLVDFEKEKRLKALIGELPNELKALDRDRFVVLTTAKVTYEKDGDQKVVSQNTAFRRPIGILHTVVQTNAACASICSISRTQNPTPSCRGPSGIDPASVVEIHGRTSNLGPGFVYDVQYKREVCLRNNLSVPLNAPNNCVQEKLAATDRQIKLPISNYIVPDESVTWTDLAPCRSFVGTTSSAAAAQAPQHVLDAGQVSYVLDAQEPLSKLEPFRLNQKLDDVTSKLPGKMNLIYVAPVH